MKDAYLDELKDGVTFSLFEGNEVVFSSSGNWLHPLFQAEEFLNTYKGDKINLSAHDRISGKAAASLIVYLGIKKINVDLISEGALAIYEKYHVECTFTKKVDKIECITEELVSDGLSIDETYKLLRKKANLVDGIKLEVKDLSFSYGNNTVLENISFTLNKGDSFILSGDNGEGKTTLIRLILGLEKQDKGSILFDGETNKKDLCYIKQAEDIKNFPFSVVEVVTLGLKKSEKDENNLELALRRAGCYHLKNRDYSTLSGGEKQRVNLARALLCKAKLLLLDEPTASMDKKAKKEFVSVLESLTFSSMPTILLITHDEGVLGELDWKRLRLEEGCLV